VGQLTVLTTLDLSRNNISSIPASFVALSALTELRYIPETGK